MAQVTSSRKLKVILVGPSGVGKTCLVNRYFKQGYHPEGLPSRNCFYSYSKVERKDGTFVDLQVWDTAGQECYFSLMKAYYRDADVAFVCFEAGIPESIGTVTKWTERVKKETPTCVIFNVITKCDNHTKEEMAEILQNLQLSRVYFTSALTGHGINELFSAAAEEFQDKRNNDNHDDANNTKMEIQPLIPSKREEEEESNCNC